MKSNIELAVQKPLTVLLVGCEYKECIGNIGFAPRGSQNLFIQIRYINATAVDTFHSL